MCVASGPFLASRQRIFTHFEPLTYLDPLYYWYVIDNDHTDCMDRDEESTLEQLCREGIADRSATALLCEESTQQCLTLRGGAIANSCGDGCAVQMFRKEWWKEGTQNSLISTLKSHLHLAEWCCFGVSTASKNVT
eukprot:COSAG01_NODE_679_length_14296_cov_250.437575_19_plen_136_part_00